MSLRPPRSLSPFVARLLVGKNLLPPSMLRFSLDCLSLKAAMSPGKSKAEVSSSVLLSFGCEISHSSAVTSVVVCKCFVYLDTPVGQRHLATRDAARAAVNPSRQPQSAKKIFTFPRSFITFLIPTMTTIVILTTFLSRQRISIRRAHT